MHVVKYTDGQMETVEGLDVKNPQAKLDMTKVAEILVVSQVLVPTFTLQPKGYFEDSEEQTPKRRRSRKKAADVQPGAPVTPGGGGA